MDFVAAKAILDKFANTYRAAEFMADALETAASLERRGGELKNNVDNLLAQQAAQQTQNLTIQTQFDAALAAQRKKEVDRMAGVQAEADRIQGVLASQRAQAEQGVAEAQRRLADYTNRADATLADLEQQIKEKADAVLVLDGQIEALRAQARQVLN